MSERTPRTLAGVARNAVVPVEAFAQRVKRTGPDVAVNDAEEQELNEVD